MAGRVQILAINALEVLAQARAGTLRILAVLSAARATILPDVPTIAESGVPGYEAVSWYALYVPAHTPADIVKKMSADTVKMLSDPAVKAKYEPLGIVAGGSTPEQLATMNTGDVAHWAPIIKSANIRGE